MLSMLRRESDLVRPIDKPRTVDISQGVVGSSQAERQPANICMVSLCLTLFGTLLVDMA